MTYAVTVLKDKIIFPKKQQGYGCIATARSTIKMTDYGLLIAPTIFSEMYFNELTKGHRLDFVAGSSSLEKAFVLVRDDHILFVRQGVETSSKVNTTRDNGHVVYPDGTDSYVFAPESNRYNLLESLLFEFDEPHTYIKAMMDNIPGLGDFMTLNLMKTFKKYKDKEFKDLEYRYVKKIIHVVD